MDGDGVPAVETICSLRGALPGSNRPGTGYGLLYYTEPNVWMLHRVAPVIPAASRAPNRFGDCRHSEARLQSCRRDCAAGARAASDMRGGEPTKAFTVWI
jgi:hypothetical protein